VGGRDERGKTREDGNGRETRGGGRRGKGGVAMAKEGQRSSA